MNSIALFVQQRNSIRSLDGGTWLKKSEIGGKIWTLSFASLISYLSLLNALNSQFYVMGEPASPLMTLQAVPRYTLYVIKLKYTMYNIFDVQCAGEPIQSTRSAVAGCIVILSSA